MMVLASDIRLASTIIVRLRVQGNKYWFTAYVFPPFGIFVTAQRSAFGFSRTHSAAAKLQVSLVTHT